MFEKPASTENSVPQSPVSQINPTTSPKTAAVIGESICVKGEISGNEDLIINGRVEGSVHLPKHELHVGAIGRIQANLTAQKVLIDGEVNGDITGVEKVIVSKAGRVHGNIVAPRVTLEDGAKFKGSIDMDPTEKSAAAVAPAAEIDQAEAVKQALRDVRRKSASGIESAAANQG